MKIHVKMTIELEVLDSHQLQHRVADALRAHADELYTTEQHGIGRSGPITWSVIVEDK